MEAHLRVALADLNLSGDLAKDLNPEKLAALAEHWQRVRAWNQRTNLTAITSDSDAARLHYRDSLEVAAHLCPGSILDIGSGAGFPGIPLAIWCGAPVTLLEPRRKRATFLRLCAAHLGLPNVRVVEKRSTGSPHHLYNTVVTRATFSDRAELLACRAWVGPGGRLIAMRTDPGDPAAPVIHEYRLGAQHRVLEIWET